MAAYYLRKRGSELEQPKQKSESQFVTRSGSKHEMYEPYTPAPWPPLRPYRTFCIEPESGLKHDEDLSRLRRVLKPVIRRSARWVRMTVDELKGATESRQHDIESVIEILGGKREDADLGGYDDWVNDFLRIEGNDVESLARLLVNAKHDSPWILRPDCFQQLSSRTDDEYPPDSVRHSIWNSFKEAPTEDSQRSDIRRHPNVDLGHDYLTPDLMLGLAGFIPMPRPGLEDFPPLRHESWLEDISRHLLVDPKDDSKVSVVFGKRCRPGSSKSVHLLAKQTLDSITAFGQTTRYLKHRGLCPNTLPMLVKIEDHSSVGVVEIFDIKFSEIFTLWKALANLVHHLEVKDPQTLPEVVTNLVNDLETKYLQPYQESRRIELLMRPPIFSWVNLLYETVAVLCTLGLSFSINLLAIQLSLSMWLFRIIFNIASHHQRRQISRNRSIKEVVEAVDSIFPESLRVRTKNLVLGPTREGDERWIVLLDDIHRHHDSLRPELEALHYTALCVQMICLALQSFSQAHTGELHFSFSDHGISKVHLLGAGEPFRTVVAHQQKLTCFEGITKSGVLVFQVCEPSGQRLSDALDDQPCDIISSLDNIIRIWGSSQSNYRLCFDSETPIDNIVWIGGGVLHPSQTHKDIDSWPNRLTELWHWTSETDRNLPAVLAAVKQMNLGNLLGSGTKIRIGALVINTSCPLSSDVDQKSFREIAQDHLAALEAFAPHWDLNTAQVGLQGGQWVVPQMMIGWQKLPGRTRKQGILEPGKCLLIPELSKYWGLQMSLCTGVLRRVSLQEVIATCIESYMTCRLPQMKEWPMLKKIHCMVDALHGKELAAWFQDLPDEYQVPASMIVREILNRLQHTGVDDENMLRIGWVQRDTGLECLKIPCTKANSWAKMLVDCTETVTFACVTHLCFETTGRVRTCSKFRPAAFDPARPLQLSTKVRPRGVDYSSRTTPDVWEMQRGRSYWMGREDLMLLANVGKESESTVLKVKKSSMPVKLFKRMNTRATVRETNDHGAVECIIVADYP